MKRLCRMVLFVVAQCAVAADFETAVLPILRSNCLPCHDNRTHSSGFDATTLRSFVKGGARHGMAIKPGDPEGSSLVKMLTGTLEPRMPLGKTLAQKDLDTIKSWIQSGAAEIAAAMPKQEKYWAFAKPQKTPPPSVQNAAWARNDVDRFILAKLEEKGLKPSPEASKRTLIRRLYFDLLGVPPSPDEIKKFVNDSSPKAYDELVDNLLTDKRYGERWGRHWLDLARYADTNGYEEDTELTHAWRYRDYVVDSFNADKPYDKFIVEQIAGDEWVRVGGTAIPDPDPEKVVAATFLRLAPFNKTPVSDENRDSILSEMTSTVSSVFLGMTVGCAKCHDHKYDSISQKDFYRMKAFFATLQITSGGRIGGTESTAFFKPGQAEWAVKKSEEKKKELAVAKAALEEFEKPLLERLSAHRKKAAKPEDLKRALDTELDNAQGFGKTEDIFTAQERNKYQSLAQRVVWLEKAIFRLEPRAWSVHNAEGPPLGPSVPTTYVQIRGDFDRLGESVEPGFLTAIQGNANPAELELDPYRMFPTRGRRSTLAHWIASPENPLTARVMINRIWHNHFGRGIVETTSDFGKNGTPPTHPELLDWLAMQFVEEKWSIKAIHRLLLLSNTYRQRGDTAPDTAATKLDPENRFLWKYNARRLEGEAVRDSVLAVSGQLNLEQGGPPVYPPMPAGIDPIKIKAVDTWETSTGPEIQKRSLYIFQRRSLNYPFLETMDAAVPNATCDRRRTSVTSLQSLSMYNGELMNQQAGFLADRVIKETGPDPREQVDRIVQLALGRAPKPEEQQWLLNYIKKISDKRDALVGVARIMINSNEFTYID